jgi:hypothetical protein
MIDEPAPVTVVPKLVRHNRTLIRGCDCRRIAWETPDMDIWNEGNPDPCYVRIMLENSGCALWDASGCGNVSDSLPLPHDLMDDLERWITDYEDVGYFFGAVEYLYEANPAFPMEWFNRRGEALAQRLRDHLPSGWRVVHQPLRRDYRL